MSCASPRAFCSFCSRALPRDMVAAMGRLAHEVDMSLSEDRRAGSLEAEDIAPVRSLAVAQPAHVDVDETWYGRPTGRVGEPLPGPT